jgi:hypothetical protein
MTQAYAPPPYYPPPTYPAPAYQYPQAVVPASAPPPTPATPSPVAQPSALPAPAVGEAGQIIPPGDGVAVPGDDYGPGGCGPGPALSQCCNRPPTALPSIGDWLAIRYQHAFVVPVTRTVSYSVFNPDPVNPTVVTVAPIRSAGTLFPTFISINGGPAPALPQAPTPITLTPGGSAVITGSAVVNQVISLQDYVAARAQIKASDYDSPRPTNRVYFSGYYYNDVPDRLSLVAGGPPRLLVDGNIPVSSPEVRSSLLTNPGTFFDGGLTDLINAQIRRERGDLRREVAGFEKTLELGGIDGSFGVRLPFFQLAGAADRVTDVGDVSLIWKAVVAGGFDTEDVVTLGLVVTLPTGPKLVTPQGEIESVLIQPWLGAYYTLKKSYVQGFVGAVVPTESRDTGFAYTNLTVGHYFWQSRKCDPLISVIAGQLELNYTAAFDHPSADRPIIMHDLAVGTAAAHVGLGDLGLFTVGFGAPFGGYRPYQYQATASLSVWF